MVASIEPECIPMFIPFSSDIRISFTRFGLQSEYDTFPNILRYSTRQHTIQSNIKKQIESVHVGKKPQCTICQATFGMEKDLQRHIKTVHEGKKIKCTKCSALFSNKTDLKIHIEAVHEKKTHQVS